MTCAASTCKLFETIWFLFQVINSYALLGQFCFLKLNSWSLDYMTTMQSSCNSRWMQWWRRTNSKKLLLLLLWQILVNFSWYMLKMFAVHALYTTHHFNSITFIFVSISSPFLYGLLMPSLEDIDLFRLVL